MDIPNEASGLVRIFSQPTFDCEKYVKNTLKNGKENITKVSNWVNEHSENTAGLMQQAIYENHALFMEAGQNVQKLEKEMQQMQTQVNQLGQLLATIMDTKILTKNALTGSENEVELRQRVPESSPRMASALSGATLGDKSNRTSSMEDEKKTLVSILEKVEGCSTVVSVPGRQLLFEGNFRELDPEKLTAVARVRGFLFNDSLLIAMRLQQRRGPLEYKFQALYELANLAVVNVKERPEQQIPSLAFKLIVFPDTRLFRVETATEKKEWLEAIDAAQRNMAKMTSKRRESVMKVSGFLDVPQSGSQSARSSGLSNQGSGSGNPFLNNTDDGAPRSTSRRVGGPGMVKTMFQATLDAAAEIEEESSGVGATTSSHHLGNPGAGRRSAVVDAGPARNSRSRQGVNAKHRSSMGGDLDEADGSTATIQQYLLLLMDPLACCGDEAESLQEAPEDLDVFIAERNFTAAVTLVDKVRQRIHWLEEQSELALEGVNFMEANERRDRLHQVEVWNARVREFAARIDIRVDLLVQALQRELVTGAERHGGVRSVRTAVNQLIRLKRASTACELYLAYRSALTHRRMQEVRQESAQSLFAVGLSMAFHKTVVETHAEFVDFFTTETSNPSGGHKSASLMFLGRLIAWCENETQKFTHVITEVLIEARSVSFHSMASALERIRFLAEKVSRLIGIDILMCMESGMRDAVQVTTEEQARLLRDSIDQRATEEKWKRIGFQTPAEARKFLADCNECGIPEIQTRMTDMPEPGESSLSLTMSTCQFAKGLLLFVRSLMHIPDPELGFVYASCVASVIAAETRHYKRYLTSHKFLAKRDFILENLTFIVDLVLEKVKNLSPDFMFCEEYGNAMKEARHLLEESRGMSV